MVWSAVFGAASGSVRGPLVAGPLPGAGSGGVFPPGGAAGAGVGAFVRGAAPHLPPAHGRAAARPDIGETAHQRRNLQKYPRGGKRGERYRRPAGRGAARGHRRPAAEADPVGAHGRPVQYYDLLQQARMDDDSEVVHYASTAWRRFPRGGPVPSSRSRRFADDPATRKVLAAYANALERYLERRLCAGQAAEIQRHQLEQLLKKRLGCPGTPQLHAGMQVGSRCSCNCRVRPG